MVVTWLIQPCHKLVTWLSLVMLVTRLLLTRNWNCKQTWTTFIVTRLLLPRHFIRLLLPRNEAVNRLRNLHVVTCLCSLVGELHNLVVTRLHMYHIKYLWLEHNSLYGRAKAMVGEVVRTSSGSYIHTFTSQYH